MTTILDQRWFDELTLLNSGANDDAEWIQSHLQIEQEERERFIDNEVENPLLNYGQPNKTDQQILNAKTGLEKLMQTIQTEEKNEIVADLYVQKVKNQSVRINMLHASLAKNDKEFYKQSSLLYGKPKKKYFAYVAKQVVALCKQAAEDHPAEARRLKKVLSKIDFSNIDISADILPPIVTSGTLITTSEEVVAIFQAVLDEYGVKGWRLQVDGEGKRSRFSVSATRKIVYIPGQSQLEQRSRPLTDLQIEALAAHEIGVHVRRSFNGANSGLLLLQTGLDAYLLGEEGVASYVQQQCEGAVEFYGFDRYLAASLAVGLDGKPRDFRAVFSLMVDYYTLQTAVSDTDQKVVPFRAAWDVCVRIFRGTTGQTAGNIYTKDIVYMEGNIGIWHLLSDRPHVFPSLFIGKFNPLLPRHVRALRQLEILKDW